VRELQNVIEQVVIVSIASVLKLAIEELHLHVELQEEMRAHTQQRPFINCDDGNPRATQGRETARNRRRFRETNREICRPKIGSQLSWA
jgi:hypothetical protein